MAVVRMPFTESRTMLSNPFRSSGFFRSTGGNETIIADSAPIFSRSLTNLLIAFCASFSVAKPPSTSGFRVPSSMPVYLLFSFSMAARSLALAFCWVSTNFTSRSAAVRASCSAASFSASTCVAPDATSSSDDAAWTFAVCSASTAFCASLVSFAAAALASSLEAMSAKASRMWPMTTSCNWWRSSTTVARAAGAPLASIWRAPMVTSDCSESSSKAATITPILDWTSALTPCRPFFAGDPDPTVAPRFPIALDPCVRAANRGEGAGADLHKAACA
mmetsp:Transcript_8009/g.16858  ORF Transcript_8009/g.16858 Transcript_8009/m.16858 type:complete len:276 (+) Transcript_8009:547-1374(+)